jgi:hypothetical protein
MRDYVCRRQKTLNPKTSLKSPKPSRRGGIMFVCRNPKNLEKPKNPRRIRDLCM